MTFTKALWVVRDKITTTRDIEELLADAVTRGIRDLIVQVRRRGDAYYRSDIEPRAEALTEDGLDPLGKLVRDAAVVGVRIHAWGNVFFVWSHPEGALPRDRSHLVHTHPEWLLRPPGDRPADLPERAVDGRKRWPDPRLRYLDPTGGADWEGIYADPSLPEVREHTLRVSLPADELRVIARGPPARDGARRGERTAAARGAARRRHLRGRLPGSRRGA